MRGRVIGVEKTLNNFLRDKYMVDKTEIPFKPMLTVDIETGEVIHDERRDKYWFL